MYYINCVHLQQSLVYKSLYTSYIVPYLANCNNPLTISTPTNITYSWYGLNLITVFLNS